jgi:hypothetical protein
VIVRVGTYGGPQIGFPIVRGGEPLEADFGTVEDL